MSYLSPGVYVKEIDNSAIVPTVSNSVAFFSGNFTKGPIEQPFVITNKSELEDYFGKPTNETYNEWFQAYKFFDYSNQLVISRAYTEDNLQDSGSTANASATSGGVGSTEAHGLASISGIYVGGTVSFQGDNFTNKILYEVTNIIHQTDGTYSIFYHRKDGALTDGLEFSYSAGAVVYKGASHQNSDVEIYQNPYNADGSRRTDMTPAFNQNYEIIKNGVDFEFKADQPGGFKTEDGVKLKLFARTAGTVNDNIQIAIANAFDFSDYVDELGNSSPSMAQPFEGEALSSFFDYFPTGTDIGIIIRQGEYTESFIASFNRDDVDGNNRSMYIENVINEQSNIVYCVDTGIPVTTINGESLHVASYLYANNSGIAYDPDNTTGTFLSTNSVTMAGGESPMVTPSDLKNGYDEVLDKEVFEIDIVIGNEVDEGDAAVSLADTRADCIAFIGARYKDVVGKRSAVATANLADYILARDGNTPPMRTMFAAFFGNYVRIFDNFAKKYRWINCAGDMAGLRANTNTNRASWWASAGLRRGIIRNIDKLAFSPSLPQRDILYKNNINPIVAFPGEGNIVWGQKTLINFASSFDRINVRGLFNTIERAMAKAARSSVFEFNDPFTRNALLAIFNPYLGSVKAGRGISDFLVVCDTTNNTADVISRNELRVDIYIKPNYSAEFIQLTFNNVGTRSFSSVIGA